MMSADPRHGDFARIRAWGDQPVTFCKITGDDAFDQLFQVTDDFYVAEVLDEASGRMVFEFRIYCYELFDPDQLKGADLLLFDGRRMERETAELKRRTPAHFKVTAIPIGEVE